MMKLHLWSSYKWNFLKAVLVKMTFNDHWVNLIMNFFTTISYRSLNIDISSIFYFNFTIGNVTYFSNFGGVKIRVCNNDLFCSDRKTSVDAFKKGGILDFYQCLCIMEEEVPNIDILFWNHIDYRTIVPDSY